MRLTKPSFAPFLTAQDDHYRRFADLAFRHLRGAWENHRLAFTSEPLACISNDDKRFGRAEHLQHLGRYNFHHSEEYSQACASVLISHAWLLSAANYYRLAARHKKISVGSVELNATHSPKAIADALGLGAVSANADRLHNYRNTLMHLVEDNRKTEDLEQLDFKQAYTMAHCSWVIYCAVLVNYHITPDQDNWKIQTERYELPESLAAATTLLAAARTTISPPIHPPSAG